MQLLFIRHGQSQNNRLYDQTGGYAGRQEDADLTEIGHAQAKVVAAWLRDGDGGAQHVSITRNADAPRPAVRAGDAPQGAGVYGITHLYTSLMRRAVGTAGAIAEALGLAPIALPDAHETGGIYMDDPHTGAKIGRPGLGRSELAARFPTLVLPDGLNDAGWWRSRPMETDEERYPRAQRVLQFLLSAHGPDDRVALVSHGDFFNYLVAAALCVPRPEQAWIIMNNCAASRLDFTGNPNAPFVDIAFVNRSHYLPAPLVT